MPLNRDFAGWVWNSFLYLSLLSLLSLLPPSPPLSPFSPLSLLFLSQIVSSLKEVCGSGGTTSALTGIEAKIKDNTYSVVSGRELFVQSVVSCSISFGYCGMSSTHVMLSHWEHICMYHLQCTGIHVCTGVPPPVLKARHPVKWLCLLLGLGLPEQAMGWLPLGLVVLGLVVKDKPTEFSCSWSVYVMLWFMM